MKKLFLIIFLVIGFRAYSQNYDENGYQEVNIKAATSLTVRTSDSVKMFVTHPLPYSRDTVVYRDTLTSFKTYNFGSQYELTTITLTKNDTCAVVWDSIRFYSVSTYGDTALIGVRYLETFTDSGLVRVNWTAGTRTSSKKVLLLDPILKILHIQLENSALTNRSVILTIRGAKK